MTGIKLLIEYDEQTQEMKFFEVVGDLAPVLAIKVPVAIYTSDGPDLAERKMGETVFTFFDRWATTKIGLRSYVDEARTALHAGKKEIEQKAGVGDEEAQYHLAIELFTEGVKEKSESAIEKSESWLRLAAANGSREAADYLLKHWERDKASALRAISEN